MDQVLPQTGSQRTRVPSRRVVESAENKWLLDEGQQIAIRHGNF